MKEIGRVRVSDTTELVVFKAIKNGVLGRSINRSVRHSDPIDYTGFARGVFIPEGLIEDVIDLLSRKLE